MKTIPWYLGVLGCSVPKCIDFQERFQESRRHMPKINLLNVRQGVRATHRHLARHQTKGQVSLASAPPPGPPMGRLSPPCRRRLARANPRGCDVVRLQYSPKPLTGSGRCLVVVYSHVGLSRDTARLGMHPDRLVRGLDSAPTAAGPAALFLVFARFIFKSFGFFIFLVLCLRVQRAVEQLLACRCSFQMYFREHDSTPRSCPTLFCVV